MKKKILVLGTGGTIASVPTEEGLKPGADVSELLKCVPEVEALCELNMLQVMSIDSTNMLPANWKILVENIEKYYEAYDGFLILHGTDTMAYTAAALSYMIQNSRKPIVLTGSQRPMEANRTDAKENIYQSIRYLIHEDAFGVNVVFADKVIPGGRARKYKSHSLDAFECVADICRAVFRDEKLFIYEKMETKIRELSDSAIKKDEMCIFGDYNPEAVGIDIQKLNVQRPELGEVDNFEKVRFYHDLEERVLLWKIAPGMNPDMLLQLSDSFEAVVIEGFGLGGLPDIEGCAYFPVLEALIRNGKTVAVTTQVSYEGTDMSVYEVGRKYKTQLDVLEAYNMTQEAAVTKLMWILGQTKDKEKIKEKFVETINRDLLKY